MRVSPLLLLALLGCPDQGTDSDTRNAAPEPIITSPESGSTVLAGYPVTFRGVITDDDDDASGLTGTWQTASRALCAETLVGADGTSECTAVVGLDDTTIRLTARDPHGNGAEASIALTVSPTDAPTATLEDPDGIGPYYADQPFLVNGHVADTEDPPEKLAVAWTDGATPLALNSTPAADGSLADTLSLAVGEHDLTLTVTDVTGQTGSATVHLLVKGGNTPPTCAISSPLNNASGVAGAVVTFAGSVTDPDVPSDRLTAEFSSDLDGVLASGSVSAGGTASWDVSTLQFGTHQITLTGTDEVGGTCTDTILYSVGAPPIVVIEAPGDGDLYNEGATVSFLAEVSDDTTLPQAIGIAWESDVDGLLDLTGPDATGLVSFDTNALSYGEHLITVTATDLDGLYAEAEVTVTINDLPSAPGISITPSSPSGDDDLSVNVDSPSTDWEGDSISYAYTWTVNGVATAYTSATVPAAATTRDDLWTVVVTPNDGSGEGDWATASVTIGNSAPILTSVALTPDPAAKGDTFTCTPGAASDSDGDSISYTYAWLVNGAALAETSATLDDSFWSRGDVVSCTVTPDDGSVSGAAVSSASVTVSNSAPAITGVAITPSPASASDTLTCAASGYSDADGDAEATTFAWTVDGVAAGTGATLSGAFVGDSVVECTATPFDGVSSGTALPTSITIQGSAPVIADVTLSPGIATVADTLTCTPGTTTDPDGTTSFTYAYSWSVNGAAIAATTATLSAPSFAKDDAVSCGVIADDGTLPSALVSSATLTITNAPPTISAVTLSPSSPGTADTLTASVTTADLDGDSVSVDYTWYVNGSVVAGNSATLAGTNFVRGDDVYVVVTPNDGTDVGTPLSSASVAIANTAPSITASVISPDPGYVASTLSCAVSGYADLDGDADASTFAWTVNGTAAGTGATLSGAFSRADVVACTATPFDGASAGTARSDSLTISNTAPVLSAVSLTPASPTESSTLTCAPTATDADGDTPTYTYAWYVNGSVIAATSATLTGTDFSRDDAVYCRATPTDGSTAGTSMSSSSVTVGNTAPVTSAVAMSPTLVYESSTITCTPTSTDVDGDSISYTYAWNVAGSAVAATGSTLTGTYFGKGDAVYCSATPTDGTTGGTAASAAAVTVGNTAPTAPVVSITPAAAEAGVDDIVCSIGTASADVDGDTLTYAFTWTQNGAVFSTVTTTATTSTVAFGSSTEGDTFTCSATASDGTATSAADTASSTVFSWTIIGEDGPFTTKGNEGKDAVIVQKVTVASALDLYELGKNTAQATGGTFMLGLYTNSAGLPGTLVAQTGSGASTLGYQELAVTGAPVSLSAGTYWFAWICATANCKTGYSTSAAGASTNTIYYKTGYTSFPATFPAGATAQTGKLYNIYGLGL